MTVQFRWPLGMPLVDNLGSGIWEVRSKLPTRIAPTLFFGHEGEMVLLHGFIKKNQENSEGRQSARSGTQKCLQQKRQEIKTSIAEAASNLF